MYEMGIIVPSFGRPDNVLRLAKAFGETCQMESTRLYIVLQREDPLMETYNTVAWRDSLRDAFRYTYVDIAEKGVGGTGFVRPTNWMARRLLRRARPPQFIGFMGDDHLPRTPWWDQAFIAALTSRGCGYVYGADGFQNRGLTSHVVMKRQIPEALGYFAHPQFKHLYADNVWLETGKATNSIAYLGEEVLIEHIHPHASRGIPLDATYEIGNSKERWKEDGATWGRWRSSTPRDFSIVQKLRDEGKI